MSTMLAMALSIFAAQALVGDYLNGRSLPDTQHALVVRMVEARLIGGQTPVLDRRLCREIDDGAIETDFSPSERVFHAGRGSSAF